MSNIKLEVKYTNIDTKEIMKSATKVEEIHKELYNDLDKEDAFLGWLKLPSEYDKKEFEQ